MDTTDDDKSGVGGSRPEDPAEGPDEESTEFDEQLSGIEGKIGGQQLKREKIDTETYRHTAVLRRCFAKWFTTLLAAWLLLLLVLVGYALAPILVLFFGLKLPPNWKLPPTEIFIALLTAASVNFLVLAGIIFTREQRLSKPSKKTMPRFLKALASWEDEN